MKNRKYFHIAAYAFLTFVACFLFYTAVENSQKIGDVLGFWMGLLSPIAIGFVIAYIANFILKYCEKQLSRIKKLKNSGALRGLSVLLAYLVLIVILVLIVMLIVPQLVSSITAVYSDFDLTAFIQSAKSFLHGLVGDNQFLLEQIDTRLIPMLNTLIDGIVDFLPGLVGVVGNITTGISNLLVGTVISIYFLLDKERLCARMKKLTLACLKKARGDKLIGFVREVNATVGDFLSGKLLECLIMALIAFFGFLVTGVDMPLLLAAVLGISNMVPFFGPIVGMVVGAILLLLVQAADFWMYLIVSLVVMQLDGNVIGPKILGKTTGLDALWIVVAILLGGGLFGIWGVLLGVPFFAILYAMLRQAVNHSLEKNEMSVDTADYLDYAGEEVDLVENASDQKKDKKPWSFSEFWKKCKALWEKLTGKLRKKK